MSTMHLDAERTLGLRLHQAHEALRIFESEASISLKSETISMLLSRLLAAAIAASDEVAVSNRWVRVADATELDEIVAASEKVALLYCTTGDDSCEQTRSGFTKAATWGAETQLEVEFVSIDMSAPSNKEFETEKFGGIPFYPSIEYYERGQEAKFLTFHEDNRKPDAILNMIKRAAGGNTITVLDTEAEAEPLFRHQSAIAFGAFSDLESEDAKLFREMSAMTDLSFITFAMTNSSAVMAMYDTQPPAVLMVNNHSAVAKIFEMKEEFMTSAKDEFTFLSKSSGPQLRDFRLQAKNFHPLLDKYGFNALHAQGTVAYLLVDFKMADPGAIMQPFVHQAVRSRNTIAHEIVGVPETGDADVHAQMEFYQINRTDLPALLILDRESGQQLRVDNVVPSTFREVERAWRAGDAAKYLFVRSDDAGLSLRLGDEPEYFRTATGRTLNAMVSETAPTTDAAADASTSGGIGGGTSTHAHLDTLLLIFDPSQEDASHQFNFGWRRFFKAFLEMLEVVKRTAIDTGKLQVIKIDGRENDITHPSLGYHRLGGYQNSLLFWPANATDQMPVKISTTTNNPFFLMQYLDCWAFNRVDEYELRKTFSGTFYHEERREDGKLPKHRCSTGWASRRPPKRPQQSRASNADVDAGSAAAAAAAVRRRATAEKAKEAANPAEEKLQIELAGMGMRVETEDRSASVASISPDEMDEL